MTKTLKVYFALGNGPLIIDDVEIYADITATVRQSNGKIELIDWYSHGPILVNGVFKTFNQFQLSRRHTSELFLDKIETNAIERALKAADSAWEVEEYA